MRKAIQIINGGDFLCVLCNDGTIWSCNTRPVFYFKGDSTDTQNLKFEKGKEFKLDTINDPPKLPIWKKLEDIPQPDCGEGGNPNCQHERYTEYGSRNLCKKCGIVLPEKQPEIREENNETYPYAWPTIKDYKEKLFTANGADPTQVYSKSNGKVFETDSHKPEKKACEHEIDSMCICKKCGHSFSVSTNLHSKQNVDMVAQWISKKEKEHRGISIHDSTTDYIAQKLLEICPKLVKKIK